MKEKETTEKTEKTAGPIPIYTGMSFNLELKSHLTDYVVINGIVITDSLLTACSFIQHDAALGQTNLDFDNSGMKDLLFEYGKIVHHMIKTAQSLGDEDFKPLPEMFLSLENIMWYAERLRIPEEIMPEIIEKYRVTGND